MSNAVERAVCKIIIFWSFFVERLASDQLPKPNSPQCPSVGSDHSGTVVTPDRKATRITIAFEVGVCNGKRHHGNGARGTFWWRDSTATTVPTKAPATAARGVQNRDWESTRPRHPGHRTLNGKLQRTSFVAKRKQDGHFDFKISCNTIGDVASMRIHLAFFLRTQHTHKHRADTRTQGSHTSAPAVGCRG